MRAIAIPTERLRNRSAPVITDPNITAYIHSLDKEGSGPLEDLRAFAEKKNVPIIRREMESFLKILLTLKQPGSILEIGAGIGFSSVFFALNTAQSCTVTTIENSEERIRLCRKNIESFGMNGRITLLEGDAAEIIRNLTGPFDFIFLDGPKAQYIRMLSGLLSLLESGGILLADNVFQEGHLIESRYITPRRQRTIHERMREYVWEVKHTDELETAVITIGDGVALSIKK